MVTLEWLLIEVHAILFSFL